MRSELPGEVRKAFMNLEHRITHLEDALQHACQLLCAAGLLDYADRSEFQDSLATRRERFQQTMEDLRRDESDWGQLQDYNEHDDCGTNLAG